MATESTVSLNVRLKPLAKLMLEVINDATGKSFRVIIEELIQQKYDSLPTKGKKLTKKGQP